MGSCSVLECEDALANAVVKISEAPIMKLRRLIMHPLQGLHFCSFNIATIRVSIHSDFFIGNSGG